VLPHRTPVRFQLRNVPRCLPQTVTPRRNLPPRLFQGTIDRAPQAGKTALAGVSWHERGAPRTRCPFDRALGKVTDRTGPSVPRYGQSRQEVTFTLGGCEPMAAPDTQSATISSTPVSIPTGACGGIVFAEDRSQAARHTFGELPQLVH